jgi:hypothetical protein
LHARSCAARRNQDRARYGSRAHQHHRGRGGCRHSEHFWALHCGGERRVYDLVEGRKSGAGVRATSGRDPGGPLLPVVRLSAVRN